MDLVTEAAVNDALIREIRLGFELEKGLAEERHRSAAAESFRDRESRTVNGLGKPILNIDQRDYFRAIQKFGPDCWADREFIRDVQRLEPDLKVFRA